MLLVFFLLAVAAAAQDQPAASSPPQVRGTVLEFGTLRPVANAHVVVKQGRENLAEAVTAADGTFQLSPPRFGSYQVEASKDGWTSAAPVMQGLTNSKSVTLTREHPSDDILILIARCGAIQGTLIDKETGKPVASRLVVAWQTTFRNGKRVEGIPGGLERTGDDGGFVFANLTPGDYLIQPAAQHAGGMGYKTDFSIEELPRPDLDYESAYWPGALPLDTAAPLTVHSGETIDLGRLELPKVARYSVRVLTKNMGCSLLDTVEIDQSFSDGRAGAHIPNIPCDKDILLTGFEANTASRLFATRRGPEGAVAGTLDVYVKDEHLDVTFPIEPSVDLRGRLVRAQGAHGNAPLHMQVMLTYLVSNSRPPTFVLFDTEGDLGWKDLAAGEYKIDLRPLNPGFCVTAIRYNGREVSDSRFRLSVGSASPLEIEADDRCAAVSGTVQDGNDPVGLPMVLLRRWPVVQDAYADVLKKIGDDSGKFQISHVPPGEYRVAAIRSTLKDNLDQLGVLERLLSNGQPLTLTGDGFQTVTVKLSEIPR